MIMKKAGIVLLFRFVIVLLVGWASPGYPQSISPEDQYLSGEILVKFKMSATEGEIALLNFRSRSATVSVDPILNVRRVMTNREDSTEEMLEQFRANPLVEYAEPNYLVYTTRMPNDPSFNALYGLHNTGQTGGREDADIDAPEAWEIATGDRRIVIADIDTGVDYTHPDLADNIWKNPGEIPNNGVDDDQNGYIDDVMGWDFANNDNDPMDDFGHGTHVAEPLLQWGITI